VWLIQNATNKRYILQVQLSESAYDLSYSRVINYSRVGGGWRRLTDSDGWLCTLFRSKTSNRTTWLRHGYIFATSSDLQS
jgi:hypothetical protein